MTSEIIGGVSVQNPFRWLENEDDPAVSSWQDKADQVTVRELASSPNAAKVADAVRATFEDIFSFAAPRRVGTVWLRPVVPEGRTGIVLQVSESPDSDGRILVDPVADGPNATLAVWSPSPDAKVLVTGIARDGATNFRILNIDDGSVRRELWQRVATSFIAWAPDSSGFYFQAVGMLAASDGSLTSQYQIWWQPLEGEAVQEDIELDHQGAWPVVSADGRWTAVMVGQLAPRPHWMKRAGDDEWRRFLPDSTAMYKGVFVGDEYWAVSDDTSGWCRLVAIPLETSDDHSTWRELVPPREERKLATVTLCGERVALTTFEGGVMKLRVLDLTGADQGEVDLPGEGSYGRSALGHIYAMLGDVVTPDGNGFTFVHSALDQGPGIYRVNLIDRSVEVLTPAAHVLEDRLIERFTVEGPHGPVAYWVMRKASTPLDGSSAAIVTGYGGYNIAHPPHYSPMGAAWTELGGVWVHAQLRGGGDRDNEFWFAGRMRRKQGTFDDFHSVVQDLQNRGFADPERTGVWGTSNGGLLVGASITQWPELIRAAVAQVPILDMMQLRKDPLTRGVAMVDYGNPDDLEDAPVMHAYSPYHAVRHGIRYPALLCDAGSDDLTCPPWHSRKMVAAVEEATTSGFRVRLRVRKGTGHNHMRTAQFIEREIEEVTFFYDELMSAPSH